ncbi:UNC93-like protein MFSD11 [Saccoglossus kowalevskii]|uniref:UNC93-like protein MFSD11 n=1 Tax=Saccoglossus kowalevskii TaxID=10224 RepID=A0ABM0GKV1_SACKO|nr:PREDICTED: UNC93-like protein MFSD11-like [Saccoglossus kowalevskii]
MADVDFRLVNVIILGFAFMFLFTAFQTSSMISETVLKSYNTEYHNKTDTTFRGSGYTSLAIIYSVFAASNWVAPSVVSVIGPKKSMLAGGVMYALFIGSFIQPTVWALYLTSVLVGIGAAVIWTAQGNFLTINSDTETIGRNSGIFWALLQCSLLFGNLFVYFKFKGESRITDETRITVYVVLLVLAAIGILLFLLLRSKRTTDTEDLLNINVSGEETQRGPLQAFKRSFQLLKTKEILLLSVCFAYTGFELTFFSGVYGTCVGNTTYWGPEAKSYIGLCGILIGVGEIFGGAAFGLLGRRTVVHGRDPVVLMGYLVHTLCFYLIFLNLPADTPMGPSEHMQAYIIPNEYLALLCAFMLGFGDSCFNTQIYSILGFMFPEDSAPAFALYKFMQSIAAAAAFFYSTYVLLHWQLLILVVSGTAGAMCFCVVEWKTCRAAKEGYKQI